MNRLLVRLMGVVVIALGPTATAAAPQTDQARGLTVENLLGLEAFGRASISPDGRWAIYEKRPAYREIPRFDANGRSGWAAMQLWLTSIADPAPERLFGDEEAGLQFVAWAPSGQRLLIMRLSGDNLEYGVVDVPRRSVRWTGLTPELPVGGATAEWIGDDGLILAVRPDESLPQVLGYDRRAIRHRVEAWEKTALGVEPSRTVLDTQAGTIRSETSEPTQRVVHLDLRTMETRSLAEGLIADFAVSPDRSTLALVSREDAVPLGQPELLHMEDDRRRRLVLIAISDGRLIGRLESRDVAPHLLRWSGASHMVLVWAREDGGRWDQGSLLGVGQGRVESFDHGALSVGSSSAIVLTGVQADWLGPDVVVNASEPGDDRRDWRLLGSGARSRVLTADFKAAPTRLAAASEDHLLAFADGQLRVLSAAGSTSVSIGQDPLREAAIFDLTMGRRLKSNEAARRTWSPAIGLEGQLVVVEPGAFVRLGGPVGDDAKTLAVSRQAAIRLRLRGMSDELILQTSDHETLIDRVNADLAEVQPTPPLAVRHAGLDGREVTSWLFVPKSTEPIRGVIVSPYPGGADNLFRLDPLSMTYSSRPEVFLSAGYAVFNPYVPGDLPVSQRGDVYRESLDLAVDAVLAADPRLPADRMVLWGHSFGGYAALEVATRSSRFASYIVSSGYSDMQGVWGEFDAVGRSQPEFGMFFRFNQGWTEVGQGALDRPPWEAADAYAMSSPFLRADRITRPILFLTADLDFTPVSQTERMFSAIARNRGVARMVTYWGEKHIVWSPANIRDRYSQIFRWLEQTLAPSVDLEQTEAGAAPNVGPNSRTPPP